MTPLHLEVLVEEQSMEMFLMAVMPKILGADVSFRIYPFQGKQDLLQNLPRRLSAYAEWLPTGYKVLVVVDRDNDDCKALKDQLEKMAATGGLRTRASSGNQGCQVINRIAVEELEAWYFGDWAAVKMAYPAVSMQISGKAAYRNPDGITGGTWEAFERILRRAGYFGGGLRKIEAAREIGRFASPNDNRSKSFQVLRDALLDLGACGCECDAG